MDYRKRMRDLREGIDLTQPDFWRKSLQTIADSIDEFIRETSK